MLDGVAPDTRFQAIFHHAAIGIALVDMGGHAVESNPALQRMLGYSAEELAGRRFEEFTHPEDVDADLHRFTRLRSGQIDHYQIEKRYVRRDGTLLWGRLTVSVVPDRSGKPRYALGMVEDVSRRKEIEEQLREQALTDELTGLYNRRGFYMLAEPQFKIAERTARPLSLVYFDLDDLKEINDRCGHHRGDRLLVEFAGMLRESFRETDVLARLGGDEFVALLVEADLGSASAPILRLRRALDQHNRREGVLPICISHGVASLPTDPAGALADLIRVADQRMSRQRASKR